MNKKKVTMAIGACMLVVMPLSGLANHDQIRKHNAGIAYGQGEPHNVHGVRLQYRYLSYQNTPFKLFTDVSYAYWHTNGFSKHLHVVSLTPVVRIKVLSNCHMNIHFEAGIGPAHRTNHFTGNQAAGSKWTFQDLLGIGVTYHERFEFRLHYLHYSNAGLAKPNPGTDVKPLITFAYNF